MTRHPEARRLSGRLPLDVAAWDIPAPVETLPTPLGAVRSLLLMGAFLGLVCGIAIWRRATR